MLSFLGVFEFDFLSLDCFSSPSNSYLRRVLLVSLIPVGLALAGSAVGAWRLRAAISEKQRARIQSRHAWAILLLSYLVLPPCSKAQVTHVHHKCSGACECDHI